MRQYLNNTLDTQQTTKGITTISWVNDFSGLFWFILSSHNLFWVINDLNQLLPSIEGCIFKKNGFDGPRSRSTERCSLYRSFIVHANTFYHSLSKSELVYEMSLSKWNTFPNRKIYVNPSLFAFIHFKRQQFTRNISVLCDCFMDVFL